MPPPPPQLRIRYIDPHKRCAKEVAAYRILMSFIDHGVLAASNVAHSNPFGRDARAASGRPTTLGELVQEVLGFIQYAPPH